MCIRDSDITADELLTGTDTAKTESKTAQAEMLILELLADGKKMPSAELEKAVNDRGISSRTMRTAKSRIGDRLVTEKDGTAWVCYCLLSTSVAITVLRCGTSSI